MNSNGKKMRKDTGLNRSQLRKSTHTKKSEAKRRRMGWGKAGHIPTAQQ